MSALYTILLVYVFALTIDFVSDLVLLWEKSAVPRPSVDYFPDMNTEETMNTQQAIAPVEEDIDFTYEELQCTSDCCFVVAEDWASYKLSELRKIGQQRHIKGARAMKKADLLAALT